MYWFLSKFPFLSLCGKLRLPLLACLSSVGGSGLFCVLSSLMDPRSIITFQSVQVFICWGGVVTSKLLTWEFGNRHPSHSFLLMIALWIANEMWDRSCLKSYSPIKRNFRGKRCFCLLTWLCIPSCLEQQSFGHGQKNLRIKASCSGQQIREM